MMRIRKTKKVVPPSLLLPYFASPPRRILLSQRHRALPAVGRSKEIVAHRNDFPPRRTGLSFLTSLNKTTEEKPVCQLWLKKSKLLARSLCFLASLRDKYFFLLSQSLPAELRGARKLWSKSWLLFLISCLY